MGSTVKVTASGDMYNGAPQFQLLLDGKPFGAVQTVTTAHSWSGNAAWQTFSFTLPDGARAADVGVQFLNDAYGTGKGQDRNLYVKSVEVDGKLAKAGGSGELYHSMDVAHYDVKTLFPQPAAPQLAIAAASGSEDGAIALSIGIANPSVAGSVSLKVTGLPAGATLSAGTADGSGGWKLASSDLANLKLNPPANFSGAIALTVAADGVGSDGVTRSSTAPLSVAVTAVADQPALSAPPALSLQASSTGGAVALNLAAALTDTDGSEKLALTVSGVPAGATLSAGTSLGNGAWSLSSAEASAAKLVWSSGAAATFTLQVAATATETSNGATASATASLPVSILAAPVVTVPPPPAPPPAPSATTTTIDVYASGDQFNGAPQFQLLLDGKAYGAVQSVTTAHSWSATAAWQKLSVEVPAGTTAADVGVKFLNDDYGAGGDRNLYLSKVVIAGTSVSVTGSGELYHSDDVAHFNTAAVAWPAAATSGSTGSTATTSPPVAAPSTGTTGGGTTSAGSSNTPSPDAAAAAISGPTVIQPAGTNQVVGLQLKNNTGAAEAAHEVSFGQVFARGDVPAGQSVVATINGAPVNLQVDVKATYEDGSIKHAILTLQSPALAAGGAADVMLSRGTAPVASAPAVDLHQALTNGYALKLQLTLHNANGSDTPVTLDAAQLLSQALASDQADTWMKGSLATEMRVTAPINASLKATFDIRLQADGSVRTDVQVGNDSTFAAGNQSFTYDAKIVQGGQVTWSQANIRHYHNANWHEAVWSGTPSKLDVIYDTPYMAKTGAVPSYDFSLATDPKAISDDVAALAGKTGALGTGELQTYMPNTGGRGDIGPLSEWSARYLISQDPTARKVMLENADVSGSIPWHYKDEATGQYLSIQDHPKVWLDYRGEATGGADSLPKGAVTATTPWTVDNAHQPSLTYVPYLVTGDRYYLDEQKAAASYTAASTFYDYRGGSAGNIDETQVREQAWTLRTFANTAWITPDTDPQNGYFDALLKNALTHMVAEYVTAGKMDGAGQLEGWVPGDDAFKDATAPWQQDYLSIVLSQEAQRGTPGAQQMLDWTLNYQAGRFTSIDLGFDQQLGAAYRMAVKTAGGALLSSWSSSFAQTLGNYTNPSTLTGTMAGNVDLALDQAALARAMLAGLASHTNAPDAWEAFGYVVGQTENANMLVQQTDLPTFAIAARLPDGTPLYAANIMVATASNDTLVADRASMLLHGNAGNDVLTAKAGQNLLYGGEGADTLNAGTGDDLMFGGTGDDRLVGGPGNNLMVGGDGADVFVFKGSAFGHDTIQDFSKGTDRLEFQGTGMSAAQILATGTQVGEDFVLHVGTGDITLIHTTATDLSGAILSF